MKNPEEIFELLKSEFGEDNVEFNSEGKLEPWIIISPGSIDGIAKFLRDTEGLDFDYLMCLSGVHYPKQEQLGVTYHLNSLTHKHVLTLKVLVPQDDPQVNSVEAVWKTANWHEREAYDMYGIIFNNHPKLERILCPEDWEGFPLRKDYEEPEFYRGMKVPY